MGLLDKLFGKKDPAADLDAAEAALERGDGVRALELARRAGRGAAGELATRARETAERARETIIASALATAAEREEAELHDEAADWLEIALDHVTDDAERHRLEARREALLDLHEAAQRPATPVRERDPGASDRDDPDAPETAELELDEHYELLVDMLRPDVAARYRDRSESFRRACVALSESATDVALPLFDAELETAPDDAVARLERGRCHLLAGDAEAARVDLEAAWEELGDEPLDDGGALSVPELWAQALHALERPAEIAERLEPLVESTDDRPDLAEHYAAALLALGRDADAESFLDLAARRYPGRSAFPLLFAGLLARQDRRDDAIDLLEAAVAPSCATGNCAKPPLHPPSLRALAELHLGSSPPRLDRVGTLLSLLARARRGRLTAADQLVVARYRDATGDTEGAAEARAEAARLAEREAAGETFAAPGAAPRLGGGESVL